MTNQILMDIIEIYERIQKITIELDANEKIQRVILEKLEKYGKDR